MACRFVASIALVLGLGLPPATALAGPGRLAARRMVRVQASATELRARIDSASETGERLRANLRRGHPVGAKVRQLGIHGGSVLGSKLSIGLGTITEAGLTRRAIVTSADLRGPSFGAGLTYTRRTITPSTLDGPVVPRWEGLKTVSLFAGVGGGAGRSDGESGGRPSRELEIGVGVGGTVAIDPWPRRNRVRFLGRDRTPISRLNRALHLIERAEQELTKAETSHGRAQRRELERAARLLKRGEAMIERARAR